MSSVVVSRDTARDALYAISQLANPDPVKPHEPNGAIERCFELYAAPKQFPHFALSDRNLTAIQEKRSYVASPKSIRHRATVE